MLCALPGFAAPGGRCALAPVLVPWLWPAACLSGVPRGPSLVRRASSGPVPLRAPVGFRVAVVPSPTPRAVAPGFTGWLRGARGGRPRTGLIVPAAGPCRGKGAGRAPRRTRSGPRDGVVPGGSLWLRSWAACAAVVWRVWTRSLTRPVSRTVRLSTGDSAGAPALFRVDADTSPFGSEDATPGSRACVCACSSWPGWAGRPPGRVMVRLTFSCGCLVLPPCSAPSGLGLPALRVFFFPLLFFSLFLSPFSLPPLAPPLSLAFCASRPRVPWALALFVFASFSPPCPVFFLFFPFFRAVLPLLHPPHGPLFCRFWCPGSRRFVVRPHPLFRPPPTFFFPVVFSLFAGPSSPRRAEQEAPRLTTESLAARGDSLQHLGRRIAASISLSVCPASSSTATPAGGPEEEGEFRRRINDIFSTWSTTSS